MFARFWKRSETWGFGLAIATLIVMAAFLLRTWNELQAAGDEVLRTQRLNSAATAVLETFLDAETGQRGFLLTGKDEYLEPYNHADRIVHERLAELQELSRDDPRQWARMSGVNELAERKLAELRDTIAVRQSRGLPAALTVVETGHGLRTMEQLRAALAEMQDAEASVYATLQHQVQIERQRMPYYIGGGSSLLLALLVAAFLVIRREAQGREDALFGARQSRRQAESARDLLDLTLRSIGDAVITTDCDARITMINAAAQEVTGWGSEAVGHDADEVFRIVNEYTRQPVESPIAKVRRTGSVAGLASHTVLLRRNGGEVPIDDSGAPIRGPEGVVAGYVLVFRDVAERKQSEEALRQSEERFRTMANAAPALLWLAGTDGAVSFFNRHWLDFTGCREDSQLGAGWLSGIHPGDRSRVREEYDSGVQARQMFKFEARLRRVDGAWRSVLFCASPYANAAGEHAGYVTASFDVTGLKEAQYSLQISERRFRTLVAGTTALVWQTDSAGNFSAPMPQWEEFTGQRWPAYKGRGAAEAVHPADRDAAAAAWRSALQDGAAYSADFRLWHEPSRSWRHMVARGTPVTGDNGEIIEWIGAMTDDTARRRLEDKLRQSAKMESLGVLAGGVAHDFNNILVGILGNASLLESTIRDPSERDLVQEIVHAGERAATLTQQMLAYSGRGRFVVEVASVAAEIARLEPQLRALLPSHVALSLELDRTVPETEIDRVQIEQLLTNLVVNAAESIEGSSGSITIAARPAILSANADGFALGQHPEAGSYAVIEVRDTGHGMDAATQAKIFDPFFSTRFTGRGLGLPAALGIARGHLGAIRLYSRPGEGATFQVYLPAFTRAVAAARAVGVGETEGRIAEPAIKDSRRSVLIVDDEEVVRSFASSALDRQGFRAIPAESGKRAVEMLRADPAAFAAVLLDLTMPGMSGQQTLAALRAIRPDLPVLASSGYSASDAESQFGGRVEGFIQKPYTPRELADALRQVLALEVISDD